MNRLTFRSLALSCCVAVASAQAPVNDEPAGALPVADGYNGLYSNVGATLSVGYTTVCGSGATNDVFFVYAAALSGNHNFATCTPLGQANGSMPDTIVNVYDAAAPTTSVACNDDNCVNQGLGSLAIANLTAGNVYFVRVSRYGTNLDGTFHFTVVPPAVVPASDTCAGAPAIGLGYTQFDMAGATGSNPSPTCASFLTTNPDVWMSFTAPFSGSVALHRESDLVQRIAVYTGACGAEVPVSGTNVCVNSTAATGIVTRWTAVAGTTYLIRIGTTAASTTVGYVNLEYEFSYTFTKTPIGPGVASLSIDNAFGTPGDVCVNVITLQQGAFPAGWFYGVDVSVYDLLSYPILGAPFFTVLDGSGAANYVVPAIPDPFGITVYTVAVTFNAFGVKTRNTPAAAVVL
jgi:hypothetical protein